MAILTGYARFHSLANISLSSLITMPPTIEYTPAQNAGMTDCSAGQLSSSQHSLPQSLPALIDEHRISRAPLQRGITSTYLTPSHDPRLPPTRTIETYIGSSAFISSDISSTAQITTSNNIQCPNTRTGADKTTNGGIIRRLLRTKQTRIQSSPAIPTCVPRVNSGQALDNYVAEKARPDFILPGMILRYSSFIIRNVQGNGIEFIFDVSTARKMTKRMQKNREMGFAQDSSVHRRKRRRQSSAMLCCKLLHIFAGKDDDDSSFIPKSKRSPTLDLLIHFPEIKVLQADVTWGYCGGLTIKGCTAKEMLDKTTFLIPQNHSILRSINMRDLPQFPGQDPVQDKEQNINLLHTHIRDGRWFWITSSIGGKLRWNIQMTEDLHDVRQFYFVTHGDYLIQKTFQRGELEYKAAIKKDARDALDTVCFGGSLSNSMRDRLSVELEVVTMHRRIENLIATQFQGTNITEETCNKALDSYTTSRFNGVFTGPSSVTDIRRAIESKDLEDQAAAQVAHINDPREFGKERAGMPPGTQLMVMGDIRCIPLLDCFDFPPCSSNDNI